MTEELKLTTPPTVEIPSVEDASKMLVELEKHVLKQFGEEFGALCAKHNVTLHPVIVCDIDPDGKESVQRGIKAVWGGPARGQN